MVRPGGGVQDVGRVALDPQMLLSSRMHFWKAALEGVRPPRACAGISGSVDRRYNNLRCPKNQQARPNHRPGCSSRIGCILPRIGRR